MYIQTYGRVTFYQTQRSYIQGVLVLPTHVNTCTYVLTRSTDIMYRHSLARKFPSRFLMYRPNQLTNGGSIRSLKGFGENNYHGRRAKGKRRLIPLCSTFTSPRYGASARSSGDGGVTLTEGSFHLCFRHAPVRRGGIFPKLSDLSHSRKNVLIDVRGEDGRVARHYNHS